MVVGLPLYVPVYSAHAPTPGILKSLMQSCWAAAAAGRSVRPSPETTIACIPTSGDGVTSVHSAAAGELLHQLADHVLGVAEEHPGLVREIQLVVDPRKPGVLAPLDREYGAGPVGVDDRHAVDR